MKKRVHFVFLLIFFIACEDKEESNPLVGTWNMTSASGGVYIKVNKTQEIFMGLTQGSIEVSTISNAITTQTHALSQFNVNNSDDGLFVVYRKWYEEGGSSGRLGAAYSEDGEDWRVIPNINSDGNPPWGGGGGGFCAPAPDCVFCYGGGGGGGYARAEYIVTGGDTLAITIGGISGTSSVTIPTQSPTSPLSASSGGNASGCAGANGGNGCLLYTSPSKRD